MFSKPRLVLVLILVFVLLANTQTLLAAGKKADKKSATVEEGIIIESGTEGRPDNSAPIFDPISNYIMEPGATLAVPIGATDIDGQELQLTVTGGIVVNFQITNSQPGRIEGIAYLEGWSSGTQYINYYVTDSEGGYTSAQVPIVVDNANIASIVIQPLTNSIVRVGETLNIPIVAQSIDPIEIELVVANLGPDMDFQVTNQLPGLTTGILYVHPYSGGEAVHNIQFNAQAEPGVPLYAAGILRLQVDEYGYNSAPIFDPISNYIMEPGATLAVPIGATDIDGQELQLTVTGGIVVNFQITNSQPGRIEGIAYLEGWSSGTQYINYYVTDSEGGYTSAQVPIVVDNANIASIVIQPLTNSIVRVGETLNIPIVAQSIDPIEIELVVANLGPDMDFQVTNQLPGLTTGILYVHPYSGGEAVHNIQFNAQAEPGVPLYAAGILRLQVDEYGYNSAPIFDPISNYIMEPGATLAVPIGATDIDGQELQLTVTGGIVVNFQITNSQPGRIEGIAYLEGWWSGTQYINYYVTDSEGGYTSAQVPIVVDNANIASIVIQPLTNSIVRVGETLNIPIVAQSIDPIEIELVVANLGPDMDFQVTNQLPGLTTGILYVHPYSGGEAVHNIQFNAQAEPGVPLYALGVLRLQIRERSNPPKKRRMAIQ